MTKPIGRVLLLLSMLCIAPHTHGATKEDKTVVVGQTGRAISRFVNKARKSVDFSGAVLAAKDGKVVAAVAAGSTGPDSDAKRIDTTTLFEIASSTKPFTANAILLLEQQGKLSLDDSIAKHLPEVPDECHAITIRHLLQHTSGIPGSNYQGVGDDLSAVLPTFLAGGPRHVPGTHFEYWNQGYALLSEIVARASAKSYVDYCKAEIFAPANMRFSRFTGDTPPADVLVAIGVSTRGAPRSALDHPYADSYGLHYRGMGGLVTNVWDLWRWDRALREKKLLSDASLKKMTTPGPGAYALGWRIDKRPDGKSFMHHGGSVRGFTCDIRRYPEEDACLFVLTNSDDSTPMGLTRRACEQLLFGEKLTVELPEPVAANDLASIVGEYHADGNRTLTIERRGRIARAMINWSGPISYGTIKQDAKGNYEFVEPRSSYKMQVERDATGKAKAFTMLEIRFER